VIARSDDADRDRVFLDANVLFSAAYRSDSGLRRLWTYRDTTKLLTTFYAAEEARRNLPDDAAQARLAKLLNVVEFVPDILTGKLPAGVVLPEKDRPILLSAIAAAATHLITGDRLHFGRYFGRRIAGVLVERPADYIGRRHGVG
jgi:uncharacterized protein